MPPETGDPAQVPAVTPAATPAPAPAISIPVAPAKLPLPPTAQVQKRDDPTVDFERQCNQMRGEIKARQGQWDEWQGNMTTAFGQQTTRIQALETQLAAATGESTGLQEQLGELATLRETAGVVPSLQQENAKLRFVMGFPSLIAQAKVVEVEQEDGTKVEQIRNVVLELALSSTLTGEPFQNMVQELAATLGALPAGASLPPVSIPATQGATPGGGPTPKPVTTVQDLRRQREEASLAGDYTLAQALNDQIVDFPQTQQ